ncbi:unnamed protein product [Closterium sp. NIES-54]
MLASMRPLPCSDSLPLTASPSPPISTPPIPSPPTPLAGALEQRCWSPETPCHACCPRCFNCLLLSRHQLNTRSSMPSPLPATPFPSFRLLLHRLLESSPLVGHCSHATDPPASGAGLPLRCRAPPQVQVSPSGAGLPLRCRAPPQVQGSPSGAGLPLRCRAPPQVQVSPSGAGLPLRCRSPPQVQGSPSGAGLPLRCRAPPQVQVSPSGAGSLGVCGVWPCFNRWPSLLFQFWQFSVCGLSCAHAMHNDHRCVCALQVEGRGVGVNTDTSPRLSPVAVQGLVGTGGRQRCSMAIPLQQGRVSGWAWPLKVSLLPLFPAALVFC